MQILSLNTACYQTEVLFLWTRMLVVAQKPHQYDHDYRQKVQCKVHVFAYIIFFYFHPLMNSYHWRNHQ